MLRLLVYLVLLAPVTYGALWLAEHPGTVVIDWGGYEIRMALGVLVGLGVLGAIAIVAGGLLLRGLLFAPRRLREKHQLRRHEQAIEALNHTMTALAMNDHREAERQLNKSRYFLKSDPAVTRLLGVQLAHATGKEADARNAFDAMLEDARTRPVALRGKIRELMQKGEWVHARDFAEEAWKDRPGDHWLVMVLLDILFREQDWHAAERVLDRSTRKHALTRVQARHYRAQMLTARAQTALAEGRDEQAEQLANLALKQQPDVLAARLLIAEALVKRGDDKALMRSLERSWAKTPHPALADLFMQKLTTETSTKVKKRAARLVASAADHAESDLLQARVAMQLNDWESARNALKTALSRGESPRIYELLAELEAAENDDDKQAAHWLSMAVSAPKEEGWHCTQCGHAHEAWQTHCEHCKQFDTIIWTRPTVAEDRLAAPEA